jgi:hypothetical protein
MGFVVCDDIWFFKEMRDNFWYKIPDQYKYDLSSFGHWSGTGIFTFNREIKFFKYDVSNWTLVTAYFNLTKCYDASKEINDRGKEYYMSHALSTLNMPYNLVIYCDEESLEYIKELRPKYLEDKTHYVIRNFDEFKFNKNGTLLNENFSDYRKKIIDNRKKCPYNFDNRNTASYYLFCMSRYAMLKEAIEVNTFNSTHFCWINFCIERMGFKNLLRLEEALSINRDKFSTCYIDYIPEDLIKDTSNYFKWGRCSMCSGFFTGNKYYMHKVCDLIENKFLEYLDKGYGHADEQLYSPVYFDAPHLFEHYYGDYNQMITNYAYVYDAPEPIINNFIRNSFKNNDVVKCYEACNYLFKSWSLNKCIIKQNEIYHFFYWYMHCKKILEFNKKKLAYYTCYFGANKNNYSRLIPPLPSTKYDCYYFTNDIEYYNILKDSQWIAVFMDNIPVHNCQIKDTMESKLLRTCPHKFEILNNYDFLCWFDSKTEVYESKINELVVELSNSNKTISLSKKKCNFTSVWDEFNLSMNTTKYLEQKEQNIKYINKKINEEGYSETINVIFCGTWSLRKMCNKTKEFGEYWYSQIQECGIQDQISLQFVTQNYIDFIIPVEYQETWKYFYE